MTAAAAPARAQAKIRQTWIDDLHRRCNVTPVEKLVGTRIALHQNLKTGACYPSAATLSAETGIPERSVFRAIDGLRRKGRLMVKSGGRGRANQYLLAPPTPDKASGVTPDKPTLTRCQANLKETPKGVLKNPPLGEGEREARLREQDSPDPGGAPLKGAPGYFEERPETDLESEPSGTAPRVWRGEDPPAAAPSPSPRADEGDAPAVWREILACYRRGWASDDDPKQIAIARIAFAKLIGQGTPPSEIAAGVKRWVAAADAPRYLPHLFELLSTGAWQSEPPAKKKRRAAAATGVALAGGAWPRTNGKVNMSRGVLMRAGYVTDENGNFYHPDGNSGSAYFWLPGARGAAS